MGENWGQWRKNQKNESVATTSHRGRKKEGKVLRSQTTEVVRELGERKRGPGFILLLLNNDQIRDGKATQWRAQKVSGDSAWREEAKVEEGRY